MDVGWTPLLASIGWIGFCGTFWLDVGFRLDFSKGFSLDSVGFFLTRPKLFKRALDGVGDTWIFVCPSNYSCSLAFDTSKSITGVKL